MVSVVTTMQSLSCMEMTFGTLLENYKRFIQFDNRVAVLPSLFHRITSFDEKNQNEMVSYAQGTYPLIHSEVIKLCDNFITFKMQEGSNVEKALYKNMTVASFITRCFKKRPLTFCTSEDNALLRDGTVCNDDNNALVDFAKIGADDQVVEGEALLPLKKYISYEEMQISALLGISSPTRFINDGNRYNKGNVAKQNTFQEYGIYSGLVGARFEKQGLMEWQHIIITETQNVEANGYGLEKCDKGSLKLWSEFYGCKFPTLAEAKKDSSNKYILLGESKFYFNTEVYKKRIRYVIEPFLLDANKRGKAASKQVYVYAVAIGLGVWAIEKKIQTKCMIEVYKDIISSNDLKYIADIDFAYFDEDSLALKANTLVEGMSDGSLVRVKDADHCIKIHFSKNNPAKKLEGSDSNKLLVASYAWDGASYPGNEFFSNSLSASGDPAAACCSSISWLQNIGINTCIKWYIINTFGIEEEKMNLKKQQEYLQSLINLKTGISYLAGASVLAILCYSLYYMIKNNK